MIQYTVESGWQYVSREEALSLRQGEEGVLFRKVLEQKLLEFNPDLVDADNVNEIINHIESVRNNIEGNAEILKWMRGEKSINDPKENRQRNVTLIDYEKPGKNLFQITDEWNYTNGRKPNRADIMFLINGLPVALAETKSAKKKDGIEEAFIHIRRYHHETPEMLVIPQVFNITCLIDFYYGVTWNLDRKNLFNWKDVEKGNFEKKVKGFFNRERFLRMLREWILFYIRDDELRKTILRQHQSRAVEKIVHRCIDKQKKTGLIWHTQGSGKTFTMITAARQILQNKEIFGKSTVILMIDRNELEGQLKAWVEAILGELQSVDIKIEIAESKRRLRELLENDFRGLIVSMIHKFEGIPKDICKRDNIFVFMDEAHRSVAGDLGNYLTGALPRATLIGFTGTPIDRTAYGKGTFKIFGKEDEKGYLDKYSIAESIEDGTTVSLKYTLAPSGIRVDPEMLEKEFYGIAESEGISDIDDLNRILDRAVKLKSFLKSRSRIEKIVRFVAEHYRENVEPLGYKAFLVGVDREACALYKQALDKLLPPEYSKCVYTPSQHDSERLPLVHKYQVNEQEEKNARKLFVKQEALPKILIVTDKLLTGFDAPVLYCMYLDKPMRDHVLLQAIARVNRPYETDDGTKKSCGLVVDFVGIFEKLEKALSFDSDVVKGVIENIELVLERFRELMAKDLQKYIVLCKGPADDKTIEKAIDFFYLKEEREKFYKLYRETEILYEILSPSPDLRDYIEDFRLLTQLYQIIMNAYKKHTMIYEDMAKKTAWLLREKTESFGLDKTMDVVDIDANTLKIIKEKHSSDNSRIINLVNSIHKAVEREGDESPYLFSIAERAESILEEYDDRQISTQETLKEIETLVGEIVEAGKERDKMGLDINTFSIYWILKQNDLDKPETYAGAVNSAFLRFPNHKFNNDELRQLKAELYRIFLFLDREKMISLVERILKLERK